MGDAALSEWTEELRARFWSNVSKTDTCWIWTAGRFSGGYGQFRVGRRKVRAHRAAYLLTHGEVPGDKMLCHRCDNPLCVNPHHLFPGTALDNAVDREAKGRGSRIGPPPRPGARNPAARLTADQVDEIRRAAGRVSQRELAERFGMSQSQIGNIVRGICWREHG